MRDFQGLPNPFSKVPAEGDDLASAADQSRPGVSPGPTGQEKDGIQSVAELRRAIAEGRVTATAVTQHYLDRIGRLNPVLGAVIAVTPDALEQAAASDAAWRAGKPRGPLDGIPVLVKDNVQVAGLPATGICGRSPGWERR